MTSDSGGDSPSEEVGVGGYPIGLVGDSSLRELGSRPLGRQAVRELCEVVQFRWTCGLRISAMLWSEAGCCPSV